MALNHLLTSDIVKGIPIALHPEATHFRLKSGRFLQYRANPTIPSERFREIPEGSNLCYFDNLRGNRFHIQYGEIKFVSHRGNILKEYKL